MIKVLIAFSELFYGGAEKQFRELISGIDKSKFDVVVVVTGSHLLEKNEEEYQKFISENTNIKFYFLEGIKLSSNSLKKFLISRNYRKKISEILEIEKPDVAIVYNGIELSASSLYRKKGIKLIYSERESGNRGLIKLLRNKLFFKNVNKIVCNSKSACRYYLMHNIPAEYIPNGINNDSILDKEFFSERELCIVIPARIAKVKNQEVVINAIKNLSKIKYKVIFIGKIEDEDYYKYLKQLAQNNNVDRYIEFLSFSTDIKSIYRKADIIVLPSLMEGFTNVIMESYLFGRICLVSDIEMNKDVANDNQRFFNPNSSFELSNLIEKVYNSNIKLLENEIIRNHEYVVENFSVEKMIQNYENLITDLFEL